MPRRRPRFFAEHRIAGRARLVLPSKAFAVMTRDDLRELAVLTAVGVVLGLVHLTLRPGLPLLAAPAAQCSAGEAPAEQAFEPEPIESLIDGGVR